MNLLKRLVTLPSDLMNSYFDLYTGARNRPKFFDVDIIQPELRAFEHNFDTIREELENLIKQYRIPAYEEVDKFQYDHSEPKTKWKVFLLYMMGEFPGISQIHCPKTCELIKNQPNVFQALFSVLEPGRSVPAHKGPYKGYIRYHLGMKVPKDAPPSIRIEDEHYTRKERESMIFDDTWDHEVYNESKEERIVLMIDIFRPMPRIPDAINRFITKYVIKPGYAKSAIKNQAQHVKKLETAVD